jgi:hypothetical protein
VPVSVSVKGVANLEPRPGLAAYTTLLSGLSTLKLRLTRIELTPNYHGFSHPWTR